MTDINVSVSPTVISVQPVDPLKIGPAGPKGDKGDQGVQGTSGLSAYQVAVANGYVGTEAQWLASLQADVTAHESAADPHPQYTTTAEAASAAPVQSVNGLTGNVVLPEEVQQYANLATFPATGAIGTLYIAADSGLVYRWNGSAYAVILSELFGVPNGIATLAGDGKVTETQLRRYMYANTAAFPVSGVAGEIYIAEDTNKIYRHVSAGTYVELAPSPDEVQQYANLAAFPATGEAATLYIAADTGLVYRWNGSAYAPTGLQPVANNTVLGNVSGATATPVALTKTQGQTLLDIGWVLQSRNTAEPNATVPAHAQLATGAETNIDYVAAPKGTGASLAQIPDSTTTGGNKRGARATDFQKSRAAATQVASGADSTIGGGKSNTASGASSTVAGGELCVASSSNGVVGGGKSNTASGPFYTAVFGGLSNTASGDYSAILGGQYNNASGASSCILGGSSNVASGVAAVAAGDSCTASGSRAVSLGATNTANGAYSFIVGGRDATTRARDGSSAHSAGKLSALGDAQTSRHVLRAATSGATPTALISSSTGGASSIFSLPTNAAATIVGSVVAKSSTDTSHWTFVAAVETIGGAAGTTLVAAVTPTLVAQSAGAAAWAIAVTANTAVGGIDVTATGVAATNIKWVCSLDAVEVVG